MDPEAQCPYPDCSKIFSTNYNLKKHISSHHLKIKPFKCTVCNKCFGYKHSMIHHQLQHAQGTLVELTDPIAVPDLCRLLENSKDPDLHPFDRIVQMKRRKTQRDGFTLLPKIRKQAETGEKLPMLTEACPFN